MRANAMARCVSTLVLVALLACTRTLAGEELVVLRPNLFPASKGVIVAKPSLFGLPNYREKITGTVVYPDWNSNRWGCSPFPPLNPGDEGGEGGGSGGMGQSLIVMVERGGGCSFVTKARNAQDAGAAAFIVANDDAGYGTILPFMGGGSEAATIAIPGMLILGSDAAKIREHVNNTYEGGVTVSLSYFLPAPDDRVEWDLYVNGMDALPSTFVPQFKEVSEALGPHSLFEPHYQILNSGYMFSCQPPEGSCTEAALASRCGNRCWNCGRYCQNDPDDRLDKGASGQDVVKEQLRRKCVWQYGNDTAYGQNTLWWDYMLQHPTACANAPHQYDEACSLQLIESLHIPLDYITQCIGPLAYVSTERVPALERELNWATMYTPLPPTPELLVNDQLYKGGLSCPSPISTDCPVLQMICAGFAEGTAPPACQTSPGCTLGLQRDWCGECGGRNASCTGCDGVPKSGKVLDACSVCLLPTSPDFISDSSRCPPPPKSGGGFPMGAVIGIIVGALLLVGGGVWWYMRRQQNRMKDDIDNLLRQYLPMDGPVVLGEERRRTIDQTRLIGEAEHDDDHEGGPTL